MSIIQWIKSKLKRKLKITTLDKTWIDRDEVLLHAAFQVLVNYVELEVPRENHYFEVEDEILESLYVWWVKFRPQRIDPFSKKYFAFSSKEFPKQYIDNLQLAGDIEEKYRIEDNEKLTLLCKYRSYMWT